ncbi:BNR-repeat neuraminidase N-terminal domain-containing protein [Paraflavitalea sp. CAU 1676]|uniref:BNR-repeat neuraminidase N-terminal domain-containing protein n=1 Tax=Paraflavitalea sp. CAU 1676 TaxID=3032598 RepID=UPI0023DAED81|nr:BNR-repeat neuraminidase N-terminal domain-containing protein [Paraflavitalea sp. CAU 1676]MDF2188565.1 BNR-repeat neuraminidase N-terminal domain-containing protein [Paraflavitalea sp. CAU 1676]
MKSENTFCQISFDFLSTSGTYNSIGGTAIWNSNQDDNISSNLFMGFTFYYAGRAYTDFRVSTNGFISLGNVTTATSMNTNALATTGSGPIIAPLWDDLMVPGSNLTYEVSGTTGSRVMTVQWANVRWNYNASNAILSFQVKFYEGTNVIEFVYDQTNRTPNNASASIGLSGGTTANDFYSVSGVDGSAVATYSSETNYLSAKPSDGRIYRWTPTTMSYVSSTTGGVTGDVSKCNNLQQAIISVQVQTRGTLSPIALTQMKFDIVTTTVSNLTGLHIYYTGNSAGFAPVNEFNAATITPASGTITVTSSRALVTGTNYFWIVYDVSASAVATQTLDARCTEVTVGGTAYAPTVTNPSGWRTIVDCVTSPGGITGAAFWVKANAGTGTSTDNTKVSTWDDQSGNARHATNTDNDNRPTYYNRASKNLNYNPVVDFDEAGQDASNADFMDINTSGILSTSNNPYEVYAVIIPGGNNASAPGKFLFAGEAGMNKFNSFDIRGSRSINDSWNMNDLIIANTWSTDSVAQFTFDYNYNKRETFKAGTTIGSLSGSGRTTASASNALGYQRTAGIEFYDGAIAEIITYANASHGTTTREKVESYLAIKYGVTLSHDYRASNNTVVWSRSTNAAYNNNIIGIARDDISGLSQKQSKSTTGLPDILRMHIGSAMQTDQASNNGSFAGGDRSYFVVGTNNDYPLNLGTGERPSGICCRISREWLVQKTNFTNTDIKLIFDFNYYTNGYLQLNAADLRLLVDADGNFSNATILTSPTTTITAAAGVVTVTVPASSFTGTPYFSLGSVSINTVLPLEVTTFNGVCRNDQIQLKWTTTLPATNDLVVERSIDKTNFSAVATIKKAIGDQYAWTDAAPMAGTIYYRLKTINEQGLPQYSQIITVASCSAKSVQLSTNAATNVSTLMLQLPQGARTEISLFDAMGRRFEVADLTGKKNLSTGVHYLPVNIPGPVAGIYTLHVQVNGERHVFRVIKK